MSDGLAAPPSNIGRLAFLGTPDVSAVALRALVDGGFEIPLVVTRADKRRGRGGGLAPSPVKAAALELGLSVTDRLDDLAELGRGDVDLGVVVAYGRIIPVSLLARIPMVNIHFSLLPRWRGAAPVERAILAGDAKTGVCLMEVSEGLDEGGVYATAEVDIEPQESAADLRSRLADLGADLLVRSLREGLGPAVPQDGETTYAAKMDKSEARLDFTRPAIDAHRRIRVGRAWAEFRGKRLGIEAATVTVGRGSAGRLDGTTVATPDGLLQLELVKPEGKRAMSATDWANGVQPESDEHLS